MLSSTISTLIGGMTPNTVVFSGFGFTTGTSAARSAIGDTCAFVIAGAAPLAVLLLRREVGDVVVPGALPLLVIVGARPPLREDEVPESGDLGDEVCGTGFSVGTTGVALGAFEMVGRTAFPWERRCGGRIGGPPSGDDTFGAVDGICCGGSCIWKGCP